MAKKKSRRPVLIPVLVYDLNERSSVCEREAEDGPREHNKSHFGYSRKYAADYDSIFRRKKRARKKAHAGSGAPSVGLFGNPGSTPQA